MAVKKGIVGEIENMDYMQIISSGNNVFRENNLVDYSYSTGIPLIDYLFGYEVTVKDPDNNMEVVKVRKCLGVQAGSFNVGTGRTQSFKTTILIQMISAIAKKYDGNVIHYDAEQRTVLERVKLLSKLPETWFMGTTPRYALRSGAIGFDTLQNDITSIYENKIKYRDVLLKDTGEVDSLNRPIKLLPPTVILIDSIQDVVADETKYDPNNKKFDDNKELRGNMVGAQTAKTIRGFITDILPMLREANIIVFAIAHKTSNMSLNPFAPPKKQFGYGSADERISGGSAVEFNASMVLNLSGQSSSDSRFSLSSDGFNGNTTLVEPTKSSTNESGNAKTGRGFEIIIDRDERGVDNLRTLLRFLKDKNRLKGNNAGWRVVDKKGEPISEKFTWKNIYKDFEKDRESYKVFMQTAKEELETLLSKSKRFEDEPMDLESIVDSL